MIGFILGIGGVVLATIAGLVVRGLLEELEAAENHRRRDRRLADERWQLLQERHDAVIELIAQIPECPCLGNKPGKAEPKPRKKAK